MKNLYLAALAILVSSQAFLSQAYAQGEGYAYVQDRAVEAKLKPTTPALKPYIHALQDEPTHDGSFAVSGNILNGDRILCTLQDVDITSTVDCGSYQVSFSLETVWWGKKEWNEVQIVANFSKGQHTWAARKPVSDQDSGLEYIASR